MYNDGGEGMLKIGLELLQKIEEHGFKAYIVGGFVRDYYLKQKSLDIDISTNATPYELSKIFPYALVAKTKYSSVSLMYKEVRFEITTWRKEIAYQDRKPIKMVYVNDLITDLKRRDFTINTLCFNSKGELIDKLGGLKDLEAGIVRMVGDPLKKVKEDVLRSLRAVRFATNLNFKLEPSLKAAIIKTSSLLKDLSYVRKKEELTRIFTSPNAYYGVELLLELKLEQSLALNNLNNLKIIDDILGIWAQLLVLNLYPFNKTERNIIKKIEAVSLLPLLDPFTIYKYGLYIVSVAAAIKGIPKADVVLIADNLPIKSQAEIKLKVPELCHILKKKPGAWVKKVYQDLETNIINKELTNDPKTLKEYIINKNKIHTLE